MNSDIIDVGSVPVLPELADHVIRMALADDVSVAKLAGLIEKDQALTARILSLANSTYYKRSRSIYTVRDAVVVIGFESVRTVALGVSVLGMFPTVKDTGLDYKNFWRHSMACALYAEAMMETVSPPLAAKAFCAGLLHDIGKLVLDRSRPDDYGRALRISKEGTKPLHEIEQEIIGTSHTEVGRDVLAYWKLPQVYEESVWCHHAPVKVIDDEQYRISGMVHIANILAHMTCVGTSGNNFPQRISNPLLKRFGIESDILDGLMERVPGQIDAICEEIGIGKPSEGLFGMVNMANMRLVDISLKLQQNSVEISLARKRSETLIRLLTLLNTASKVSEVLEYSARHLFEAGLIKGFLGGLKLGKLHLVYEKISDSMPRFVKAGDEELRSMIHSHNYTAGMMLPAGVFVYLELADGDLGKDQDFISSIIGAIASSLRRTHAEKTVADEKAVLRDALKSASVEKQHAEEMLRLNQELIDASSFGLCLIDENNHVRSENEESRKIRDLLAVSGDDIVGMLDQSATKVSQELKSAIVSRLEQSILWPDNTHTYRIETRPIKVNNWMLVVIWDITEELEEQRRRLAYAKMSIVGSLAASMAHNMKSPLGAIHGFGSIIKEDLSQGNIQIMRDNQQDQDVSDMIANIITASENVLKIVNQLLNFTRKWESPEGDIDLQGFIEGIFQIVSSQAASAGVRLVQEIEAGSVRIKAEALEQVLINLLINAIKASSKDSEVHVRALRRDDGVEFCVEDHGIGMEEKQIERIFEPLYTAWPLKTGMGLGLSLAKDIVDSMGGRIIVTSKPGEGSTFTVWIPEGKG
ncbi:MAG TPA: HDOD domain-containing protein [Deltaproteobacteria bacterium]|nr:HDOD domain-containing protein [Deltaproteobacteria bacterium]